MNFLEACAHVEGEYVVGSRPNRNNNPGDINYGPFARAHGADRIEVTPAGETPRFAHFPTLAAGFAAMKALFQIPGVFNAAGELVAGYAGSTVHQALNRYAPPSDGNDTSAYEATVCRLVGCKPTDCIDPLIAAC